jgi:hypothetical protein
MHCKPSHRNVVLVLRDGEDPRGVCRRGSSHPLAANCDQLIEMLASSLHCDEDTARFYLDEAGGSLKGAIASFEDDRRWELLMQHTRRRTPS